MNERSQPSRCAASLLTEFLRTFSHEMRTPLSIVANDLYFLNSQSEAPIATWKDALAQITAALDLMSALPGTLESSETFTAQSVLDQLAERVNPRGDFAAAPTITGNSTLIIQALSTLLALQCGGERALLELDLNLRQLILRLKTTETGSKEQQRRLPSPSFSLNTGTPDLTLALAELVLSVSGAQITLSPGELSIALSLNEHSPNPGGR